jgi:hypothetical protein
MTTTIILINLTAFAWIPDDFAFVSRWQHVCEKVYGTSVARIYKLDERSYKVVCR